MPTKKNNQALPNTEIRYLGDVQRLQLNLGDVVVIKSERRLLPEQFEALRQYVSSVIPGHEVLLLDAKFEVSVMDKGGMANGAN